MKRYYLFFIFLALLSIVGGVLWSKMSFLARASMSVFRKKYEYYAFMKVWWQGAIFLFIIFTVLFSIQYFIQQKLKIKNAIVLNFTCLLLSLVGLYFTYNDFRSNIAHRWAGERLHLGFYLFWIGWAAISVFLLTTKKHVALKDLNKMGEEGF